MATTIIVRWRRGRRPADIGIERGQLLLGVLVREEVIARRDRGLTLDDVFGAARPSPAMGSRIERGQVPDVGIIRMATILSIVGLDLSARAYPGGSPLRDGGHGVVLGRFRSILHSSLGWGSEVALPRLGDPRAWDGLIKGPGWRFGVEAETHPTDAQALVRRIELKVRDGAVDGVILVLPTTRHVRTFLAAARDVVAPAFPVPGRRAVELLRAGVCPGGNAIVLV